MDLQSKHQREDIRFEKKETAAMIQMKIIIGLRQRVLNDL
jgi:hypothetical protein